MTLSIESVAALVLLAIAYILFKKKYYWLHEEYLRGLGKFNIVKCRHVAENV